METLKIEFTEIGEDYVVCRMPVTSDVHQPAGILHGGATAALVETAGSFASRYFIKDEEMSIILKIFQSIYTTSCISIKLYQSIAFYP